jgi:gliding motility-associated-like protein
MRLRLAFLFILLISSKGYAQLPPGQPQQDCINAIPICQGVYVEPASYVGNGTSPIQPCNGLICNEINTTTSCLLSGEKNAVWYTFTVQGSGLFGFNIIPNILADDYDWAVYNLTNATCSQIFSNPALEVACNYSGAPGITGCNLPAGSPIIGQNNAVFPVVAGQTYVLVVSNFEDNPNNANGYTINLLPPPVIPPNGSALIIGDTTQARFVIADTAVYCNRPLRVNFTERILRDSLTNASFFVLTPQNTVLPITNITCQNCSGGRGTQFTLTFPNTDSGNGYRLVLVDSIPDACGNIAKLDTLPFNIRPRSLGFSLPRALLCLGDTVILNSTVSPVFPGETFISTWSGGPHSTIPGNSNALRLFPNDTVHTTLYFRTATLANNTCPNKDSVGLLVSAPLEPGLIKPKTSKLCFGDTALLTIESRAFTKGATASWQNITFDNTQLINISRARDSIRVFPRGANRTLLFTANLLNQAGCSSKTDTATIQVGEVLDPIAEYDTSLNKQLIPFEILFESKGTFTAFSRWLYENTSSNRGVKVPFSSEPMARFTFTEAGKYFILLEQSDALGCSKSDTLEVEARKFILPNVLTPNNDGQNDIFVIEGRQEGLKLQIFNRWGRKVFGSDDYKNNFGGENLEAGAYYFVLQDSRDNQSYTGWIQLIK